MIEESIKNIDEIKLDINTLIVNSIINEKYEETILGGLNLFKIIYDKYIWASSHKDCNYRGAHDNTLKLDTGEYYYLECPTYRIWKDCQLFLIEAGFKELIPKEQRVVKKI